MQEVNANDVKWDTSEPGQAAQNVFATIRSLLERIIEWVRGFIQGIIAHANGTAEPVGTTAP